MNPESTILKHSNLFAASPMLVFGSRKYILVSGVGGCQKVCVWGGGGGAHRHVIYVLSVKNQYNPVVFGYMVIY